MSWFTAGFKVFADPAAFEAGMARANAAATSFKKGLVSIGVEARGMGLGLILGVGIAALRGAVEDAKKTAEQAAKVGQEIDGGTAALIRFGDFMASLKGIGTSVFGAIAQGMEKVGLWAAGLVYGFGQVAVAQAEMKKEAEETARSVGAKKLKEAEEELTKFRRETALKRASDEDKINLLLKEQVALLAEQNKEGKDTVKGKELQLKIEQNRAQIADANAKIESASETKLAALLEEKLDLTKQLRELDKDSVEYKRLKADYDANALEIAKAEKLVQADSAKVSEARAALAKDAKYAVEDERHAREKTLQSEQDQINLGYEREAQLKAQNAELEAQERRLSKMLALSSMLNSAGGEVFREASDAELQERLRRSQQTVINQQNSLVGKDGSVGQMIVGADIARLQIEIANIKSEIATREELRRNYALGGEEMARRNFRGDPLAFDDEFARLVADTRTNKEIQAEALRQLREINDRQKNGIAVVNLNKK